MLQNDGTQHWSLSRNFFDSVVTDERKLSNLENIQDDGSVDTLLNLFDANEAIKAAWNAH